MKTRIISFIIAVAFLSQSAIAQNIRIGAHKPITRWNATSDKALAQSEVKQTIQQVLNAVGEKLSLIVQPANVQNAAAVTFRGNRYILYNPVFMADLNERTGTKWAAISVLAHEVGHHVNRRTNTSQQRLELDADEFSGYALRKMGASVDEAQAAMMTLTNMRTSRTHPGQTNRLVAIETGWNNAHYELTGVASSQKTGRSQQDVVNTRPEAQHPSGTSSIIGQVVFSAAPSDQFFITKNLSVVQLHQNEVAVVGKITSLNNSNYPYLIYDENNTKLLVDRRGNILTTSGKKVGILKAFK